MKKYISATIGILFLSTFIISCGDEDPGPIGNTTFDRKALLTVWADDIIIPRLEAYVSSLNELKVSKDAFVSRPTAITLSDIRDKWLRASLNWQGVSMFEIGKAEELNLRSFTNIYPTDIDEINANIATQNFNLELPSNYDAQGLPALDYLLFGTGDSAQEVLDAINDQNTLSYINDLVERLYDLASEVADSWNSGYRQTFIDNDGSSATASVDKVVNDFLFYYEKFLRAGKVGIPAGVFTGNPLSNAVEAPFSNDYSIDLFQEGFIKVKEFFNGVSHSGSNSSTSLKTYLETAQNDINADDTSALIADQWQKVDQRLSDFNLSFREQVESDNSKMTDLYDELQKVVPFLKVDMMQALNIQVDFVDADGD